MTRPFDRNDFEHPHIIDLRVRNNCDRLIGGVQVPGLLSNSLRNNSKELIRVNLV
jgi:hypothetical protein